MPTTAKIWVAFLAGFGTGAGCVAVDRLPGEQWWVVFPMVVVGFLIFLMGLMD